MKPRLVVVGGGGHARVVMDILDAMGLYDLAGFTSLDSGERTALMFGCRRLGEDDASPGLLAEGIGNAFVAIGDNSRRRSTASYLLGLGFSLINVMSPRASVSPHAMLGRGIALMPGAIVNAGAELGDGAIVNTNASVDHDCTIGAFTHIAPGVAIAGSVRIGEEVLIGVGARIVPGVRIGDRAIVAAGSVVLRDVPPDVLVAGVPAAIEKRK